MILERRTLDAEMRAKGRRLEGYAATFNTETVIEGRYTEVIASGAFAASLVTKPDILALADHDPARILARTRSKTLRLSEDSHGLAFEIELPPTQLGNDMLALAERGDLGGMSFGFVAIEDRRDGDRRTLLAVDLLEVSVVSAWPAYPDTVVQARWQPFGHLALHQCQRIVRIMEAEACAS